MGGIDLVVPRRRFHGVCVWDRNPSIRLGLHALTTYQQAASRIGRPQPRSTAPAPTTATNRSQRTRRGRSEASARVRASPGRRRVVWPGAAVAHAARGDEVRARTAARDRPAYSCPWQAWRCRPVRPRSRRAAAPCRKRGRRDGDVEPRAIHTSAACRCRACTGARCALAGTSQGCVVASSATVCRRRWRNPASRRVERATLASIACGGASGDGGAASTAQSAARPRAQPVATIIVAIRNARARRSREDPLGSERTRRLAAASVLSPEYVPPVRMFVLADALAAHQRGRRRSGYDHRRRAAARRPGRARSGRNGRSKAKRPAFHGGFERPARGGRVARRPAPVGGHADRSGPRAARHRRGRPARSGILANEWWHRDLGKVAAARSRPRTAPTPTKWLRVPGLGDAIVAARPAQGRRGEPQGSRAAMLPLGHAGLAIWFDSVGARFEAHALANGTPCARQARLARALHDRARDHAPARSVDAARRHRAARELGAADEQPGEVGDEGLRPDVPARSRRRRRSPADAMFATPLGNDLVLEIAIAAIEGEQLGADAQPDLLVDQPLGARLRRPRLGPRVVGGSGTSSCGSTRSSRAFIDELDRERRRRPLGDGRHERSRRSPMPERSTAGASRTSRSGSPRTTPPRATLGPGNWIDERALPERVLLDGDARAARSASSSPRPSA